jgi:6-phosphogluconolactonase
MLPEVFVGDSDRSTERLVALVRQEAERATSGRGLFALALAGGSVGTTYFPALSRLPFDWPRTAVFWADERAVPASDPESNYGLAHRLWLAPAEVPDASVHRMPADQPDLDAAAETYGDVLRRLLGTPPRLDLALLGVGPDGHVASLFPGHALLDEHARPAAALTDAPKPPPRRLTLTLPTLATAHVVLAAAGRAKADVLREALETADSPLPVARLLRRARRTSLLLDPEAAARLARPSITSG